MILAMISAMIQAMIQAMIKEEIIKGIEFNYQVPYITRQNGYNYIADFGYNY